MEIERKFLVKALPERLETFSRHRIEQAYLCTDPVLRIRRKDETYILTYKGPGFLVREEHEFPLKEESYEQLLKKAEGNVISKWRYRIPYEAYVIELDVFDPPFAPLILAEVEFSTEEEATLFEPPVWFGEDVTYNPSYTNAAISQRSFETEKA
jgi:CYTH domain-containing protein